MTIWIFGHSLCLPFDLEDSRQGWPHKLGQALAATVQNHAEPAADNFYIYSSYQHVLPKIAATDLVIVGWSHPSRKSFVLDPNNTKQLEIAEQGLRYQIGTYQLFRSHNPMSASVSDWSNLEPRTQGNEFFDTWFSNYYSDFEQRTNFRAYRHSLAQTCPCPRIEFYFSQESVAPDQVTGAGFALDWIIKHQAYISPNNCHFSVAGHRAWADHLLDYLDHVID